MDVGEDRIVESRMFERCPAQISDRENRPLEVCAAEIGPDGVHVRQRRQSETGVQEVSPLQLGTSERGSD
jgi:hypothetical protein